MEQKQVATIFNNVMGPIGTGPSTSNTCGPCRISYLSAKLARARIASAEVVFPADSGYATPNGKGMRSDYAFAHGLLGRLPDASAPLLNAFSDLKEKNIELKFTIDKSIASAGEHLLDIMRITDVNGECTEIWGLSKGGGVIELIRIDGFDVSIGGENNLALVFIKTDGAASAEKFAQSLVAQYPVLADYAHSVSSNDGAALIVFPTYELIDDSLLRSIAAMAPVYRVCALPAILPVVVQPSPKLPFCNAAELAEYCRKNQKSLTQAAEDYEMAASGWSREKARAYAGGVVAAMRHAIQNGLKEDVSFDGIITPKAYALHQKMDARSLDDGLVTKAAVYSLAVMEYSNASGVVVCMPTAGASGTIAGALLAAAEQRAAAEEEIIDALLAAGVVGISISEDNDFCGGVYGCQAEVGCASALAAAALSHLCGGSAEESLYAASMALQNMLGLICDPVCGLVQVPCFSRNISAVANAIVCANVCLLGFNPVIPLQDAFDAMKASGSSLPVSLRGCGGGLCATGAGKQLLCKYCK